MTSDIGESNNVNALERWKILASILREHGAIIVLPTYQGYEALCRRYGTTPQAGEHWMIDGLHVVWDDEFKTLKR